MLSELEALERLLQEPGTRYDIELLDRLIHPSFVEIGRSGAVFTKSDLLKIIPAEDEPFTLYSQDFSLIEVEPDTMLLRYKSAYLDQDKISSKHTMRSSLWHKEEQGWQIMFHQGTPTEAFPIEV